MDEYTGQSYSINRDGEWNFLLVGKEDYKEPDSLFDLELINPYAPVDPNTSLDSVDLFHREIGELVLENETI